MQQRMNLDEVELSVFQTLNDHAVEYLVIGGCAMQFFGMDRVRWDVDLFINRSPANVVKIARTLTKLKENLNCPLGTLEKAHQHLRIGFRNTPFDMLTSLNGVEFSEAYARKIFGREQGQRLDVISPRDLLLTMEGAIVDIKDADRVKKLHADIEYLRRYISRKSK
jgi:hypothetical protein